MTITAHPVRPRQAADPILGLLQCPRCGGALAGALACTACGAPVRLHDGILDFVAGAAATQLDAIDYDQFYAIDEDHARVTYDDIVIAAGALWRNDLGDALEIGCGTGGFSMAALTRMQASRVLLTDVSLKMLAACRQRLQRMPSLHAQAVGYAAYSGQEDCFRAEAFDTCFGTAVVHHVLDVPRFLGQVHRLLKPGGVAFFMEPNGHFHHALTATLAEVLADWLRQGSVAHPDLNRMLNWMAEVHCNVTNSGDLQVLAEREDKHQFTSVGFEAMAAAAGFTMARALACGADRTGGETILAYLQQVGVSAETLRRVRVAWGSGRNPRFAALAPHDSAPSYLFWLEKGAAAHRIAATPAQAAPPARGTEAPPRLWLMLTLHQGSKDPELAVDGWCVAEAPVRAVELTLLGRHIRMPVWRPRPDVQAAVNANGAYPPLHALCSGINGRIVLEGIPAQPVQVAVHLVAGGETRLPRGIVTLQPGGEGQLIQ
ncbi:MAG TPA: class I SAM-dependent methyltransferase [Rhodopila sp.]|nr:class I SAM-dependent methyltransferase [Rhodopila sp.]